VGRVRVTFERSPAGSLFPVEASHSINPFSIGGHFPLPNCLIVSSSPVLKEVETHLSKISLRVYL